MTVLSLACDSASSVIGSWVLEVLTMPLFFGSNAIYPLAIMPGWLRTFAKLNPLSYQSMPFELA